MGLHTTRELSEGEEYYGVHPLTQSPFNILLIGGLWESIDRGDEIPKRRETVRDVNLKRAHFMNHSQSDCPKKGPGSY